jgi:hypothetical protein
LAFLLLGLAAFWSSNKGMAMLASFAALLMLGCAGVLPFSRRWFDVRQALGQCVGMRPQIRYALSLAQWLELEGARQENPNHLWYDLVFAARRLGFISVRITLDDTQRLWQKQTAPPTTHPNCCTVHSDPNGLLEFSVPGCPKIGFGCSTVCTPNSQCNLLSKACISDPRVFELMSELLAESWAKAAAQWRKRHSRPFKFSTPAAAQSPLTAAAAFPQKPAGQPTDPVLIRATVCPFH